MLTLGNMFVLMLLATGAAWLWHNHGLRERALERVKQHCRKLDIELLDDNVALKKLALSLMPMGKSAWPVCITSNLRSLAISAIPGPSLSSAPTAPKLTCRPTRSGPRKNLSQRLCTALG